MRQGARWPGCPPLAARAAHSRRPSPQSANHSWWAGGRGDAMRVRHTRACCQKHVRPGLLVPGFFRPQGCAVPTTSGTSVSPPHVLCPVTHSDWVLARQRMSDSLAKLPLLVVQGHAKPKSTPLPSLHALIRSNPSATTCPAESMSSAPRLRPSALKTSYASPNSPPPSPSITSDPRDSVREASSRYTAPAALIRTMPSSPFAVLARFQSR
jgi:hypothetical protein